MSERSRAVTEPRHSSITHPLSPKRQACIRAHSCAQVRWNLHLIQANESQHAYLLRRTLSLCVGPEHRINQAPHVMDGIGGVETSQTPPGLLLVCCALCLYQFPWDGKLTHVSKR